MSAYKLPTSDWQTHHDGRLEAMIEVAIAAGNQTLKHFRKAGLVVDRKGDDSPVTIADREAEQLTRDLLSKRYASDTIAGEEFAEQTGDNEYRWTVDPIDGTKSFICGVPLYSTLLALEYQGKPLAGMILIPGLGQAVVAAMGHGCFYTEDCFQTATTGPSDAGSGDVAFWSPTRVSERDQLSEAVFVTSEVKSFGQRGDAEAYLRLEQACFLSRTWGDGYGYLMVATGKADLMIDPICNAWDVAAMVPILTEAGGRFTDWKGVPTVRGGDGVGTNGRLHDAVLAKLGHVGP